MKITIAGVGYVGLSLAVLLAQSHEVTAVTTTPEKARRLNRLESTIQDDDIERIFKEAKEGKRKLNLRATTDKEWAYSTAELVVIATPTGYDADRNSFDASSVEDVLRRVLMSNPGAYIVIRSTVPVGYTAAAKEKFQTERLIFSPDFLREAHAMHDTLYPSRIIVGCDSGSLYGAKMFASLLEECAESKNVPVLFMGLTEAEAVKMFSDIYLAFRIGFFNELDTYAAQKKLNVRDIVDGVCLDKRIGLYYNNPSFGYGGYCIPKNARQLIANYMDVPNELVGAIIRSNVTRKEFIADQALEMIGCYTANSSWNPAIERPITVGIYKLTMQLNSDDFRNSSMFGVIERVRSRGANVIIYEPLLKDGDVFFGSHVVNDMEEFKNASDVILANRYNIALDDVKDKVYTRDIYKKD